MTRLILNIRGLPNGGSTHVARSLGATPGVSGVTVDLQARSACVEHDERKCTLNDLLAAVAAVGLQVDGFTTI